MKKQLLLIFALLCFGYANAQCDPPTNITVTGITTSTASISWSMPGSIAMFEYLVQPAGSPAPNASTPGTGNIIGAAYSLNALACGNSYDVYLRSVCPESVYSAWSAPVSFNTMMVTGPGNNLFPLIQCDENNNGTVIFNFTSIEAQLNTTNPVAYYLTSADAVAEINPIEIPDAVTVSTASPVLTRFVRIDNAPECDVIRTFQVSALSNCNVAYICQGANSLCSTLGSSYANTINSLNAEAGNNYGCLGTTPNPTWFYIPISQTGPITLLIEQKNLMNQGIDVDFILWGPFTDPGAACNGQLNPAHQIDCNYSTAATETAVISNALVGNYYILMVTNFSNQAGIVTINQTNILAPNAGQIDCTGMLLNAFLDSNGDGFKNAGEVNFPMGEFHYEKNNDSITHHIQAPTGMHPIYDTDETNTYNVSFTINPEYAAAYGITTASYTNLTAGAGMPTYSFPVTIAQVSNDLAVTIIPITQPRPGFSYQNKISYANFGNQTVSSGTVTFNADPLVSITLNSQGGTAPTASGFTYNFTNLMPFESREMTVTMLVPTIPAVDIGDLLNNSASIVPLAGDAVPENNESVSSEEIIGSFDPNDKMEAHGPEIVFGNFTANDYLYYTLRFENTGTASAINVKVNDVLDAQLDAASVRMVAASHPYVLDRIGSSLTWKFDDIQLPFATQNPDGAKGYIMFKVKPKPGYALGDVIPNTASIYFDFNPAIITNTFETTFVNQLAVNQFQNGDFTYYPNPVTDVVTVSLKNHGSIAAITVYDISGKVILNKKEMTPVTTQTVNLASVSSGMYFIEITTDSSQKVMKKLMVR